MPVIPYLTFGGNCREAMTFYASVFDTEIDMIMKASEMPDFPVPPGKEDQIAHCSIKFSGGELYASDAIMGEGTVMAGCSVMATTPDNASGKKAFDQLADGGTIEMPFQPTFWSGGFGTLTDRFGIKWMISSEEEPAQG